MRLEDRSFTDAELDAAVAAIAEPARLQAAQDVVVRTAPALQRLLATALAEGGWFDSGHDQAVREAAAEANASDRVARLKTLMAEETRLGMLVGVAVGFELARELSAQPPGTHPTRSTETTQED